MPLALTRRGQAVRAQNSAEAEVCAGVMGVKEGPRARELPGWLGEPVRIRLRTDAAAARSLLSRQGVGGIRRLEVKVWTQCQVETGRVLVEKVDGARHPAVLATKPLGL